jgi:hypothetical protein
MIKSWTPGRARKAMPSAAGGECLACERRFTTYERIDEVPYMVIKKDGRREKFDRQKVLTGLLKACEKRPVSMVEALRAGEPGGSEGQRLAGPGDFYYRNRRISDGTSGSWTRSPMCDSRRFTGTFRTRRRFSTSSRT